MDNDTEFRFKLAVFNIRMDIVFWAFLIISIILTERKNSLGWAALGLAVILGISQWWLNKRAKKFLLS